MPFTPDKAKVRSVLFEEAEKLDEGEDPPAVWVEEIEELSRLCAETASTHIAFLGTSIVTKATYPDADVYAVKRGAGTEGAYSARGVVEDVLAPAAPELGIHIGVTGREPLNNQPYFRIDRATREVLREATNLGETVDKLVDILSKLEDCDVEEARDALRAYLAVRREYVPEYPTVADPESPLPVPLLTDIVGSFVGERSEGGARAQGVAAGLLEGAYGADRIQAGRVNDPDRHLPGDVGVESRQDGREWDQVFEVRDKPVDESDVRMAVRKAAEEGVSLLAVVAVAENQAPLPSEGLWAWSAEQGVVLRLFEGWGPFVRDVVFWSDRGLGPTVTSAISAVGDHLVEAEADVESVERWNTLVGEALDRT